MANICLLTPTQPSANPRVVKEADALAEAGHHVHMLCGHSVLWADESDRSLLPGRKWTYSYVGGKPGSVLHWWTRVRHGVIRRFPQLWRLSASWAHCALARIVPELQAAAFDFNADLYIAHYVGALAAAGVVAEKKGVLLGFDAEDFESGYYEYKAGPRPIDRATEKLEREYLRHCCYVTAASPGIAAASAFKYSIEMPTSILNVFSLAERPPKFRETVPTGPLRLYWFSQTVGGNRGLEDVVCAMAALSDCSLEFYIRGRWASGYKEQLLRFASKKGLNIGRLVFLPTAPADEMVRLSAEYDVGVALEQPASPNRDLCLTNKIFSYLLAGNAVAATSTKGQRTIGEHFGLAGFLYKPGDYESLAEGLRLWHDDRAELDRARRAAWALATHKFNWEIEKHKFVSLVNAALSHNQNSLVVGSSAVG